jgi:hypothetical protein
MHSIGGSPPIQPATTNIVDGRENFAVYTFSNFKRNDVKKALLKSLISGDMETALNWSSELLVSNHFLDIWENLLLVMSKHVHLGNPKLPLYFIDRYESFKTAIMAYNELPVSRSQCPRNDAGIRTIMCEMVCNVCMATKKHTFTKIKINQDEVYDFTYIHSYLRAPSSDYIVDCFREGDPKELFISLNEFAYHVSDESRDTLYACFWVEWIIGFIARSTKNKTKLVCESRDFSNVEVKQQGDPVWLLWEILLETSGVGATTTPTILALMKLFAIQYTPGVKGKRRFMLYHAISFLTEPIRSDIPITANKPRLAGLIDMVDAPYKLLNAEVISAIPKESKAKPTNESKQSKSMAQMAKLNEMMGL